MDLRTQSLLQETYAFDKYQMVLSPLAYGAKPFDERILSACNFIDNHIGIQLSATGFL
jgi:hypothetical protein